MANLPKTTTKGSARTYDGLGIPLIIPTWIIIGFFLVIPVAMMLVYSFWIPQIFTNAYYDSKKPLTDHYMYGISLSRLFFPLYFYGCPNNHVSVLIRWEYKPYAAFFLLLWMGLQVSLLRIQEIYGARILIPKQFLPVKYDYKRKVILEPNCYGIQKSY